MNWKSGNPCWLGFTNCDDFTIFQGKPIVESQILGAPPGYSPKSNWFFGALKPNNSSNASLANILSFFSPYVFVSSFSLGDPPQWGAEKILQGCDSGGPAELEFAALRSVPWAAWKECLGPCGPCGLVQGRWKHLGLPWPDGRPDGWPDPDGGTDGCNNYWVNHRWFQWQKSQGIS